MYMNKPSAKTASLNTLEPPKMIGIALALFQPSLDHLYRQLTSILNQTDPHWICLISGDSPLSFLGEDHQFSTFLHDSRFFWQENSVPLGIKENFLKASKFLFKKKVWAIAFADQDDDWFPEKLAIARKALEGKKPLSLVHCDMIPFQLDEQCHLEWTHAGERKSTTWVIERRGVHHVKPAHFLVRNVVAGAGLLMDARLVSLFPSIPSSFLYHDHWFAFLAACYGGVFALPVPLYGYRIHLQNTLGVSPFRGIFYRRGFSWWKGILWAEQLWKETQCRAVEVKKMGLGLKFYQHFFLFDIWDFGFCWFVQGFFFLATRDPALARSCFARGIGKCVALFKKLFFLN